MTNWQNIESIDAIAQIEEQSHHVPCLIFKHSTRCSISSMAKYRLEEDWSFASEEVQPFFLDLIQHRPISAAIANHFQVHHESPQIILLHKGEVLLDASHLDISVDEIREVLEAN